MSESTEVLESWQRVWRDGFVPHLSKKQLEFLADGLRRDDRRLLQGGTTQPPPLMCVADWPCEAGCLLVYTGIEELGGFSKTPDTLPRREEKSSAATVGAAEKWFAELCWKADQTLGEPAACRWLLNWYDDTPREEMRRDLLAEVELAVAGKGENE